MVLFLSCKENENIVANELTKKEFAENEILLNKSAEEEILQLKNEGINLFHETRKIYDKSKKDYALVTFASESKDNLKEYLLTNSLNIKLSSEKLLPIEGFEDNNINIAKPKKAPKPQRKYPLSDGNQIFYLLLWQ